ncbi:WD40 repeat-like protein [Agrocybe pediades]|nr:WD40 repeat-like protein [Agrocybe pediades]
MKCKFKKFKVPNLRSLWNRGPSRELLPVNVPPTERSTDSQSVPPTERPTESQSAPPTENPQDPQLAPPAERPGPTHSGSGAGVQEQAQNPPKKLGSLLWTTAQTTLRLLEKNSDGFPPLKIAVGVLVTCLDLTQDVIGNRKEYDKLAVELKDIATTLSRYEEMIQSGDGGSVALILKSINGELDQIKDKLGRGTFRRAIEAREDQDDIIKRYRKIDSLFRHLLSDITLRTHVDIKKLRDATDATLVRTLDPAHDARYDSGYSTAVKRRGCTASTREQILQDLRTWADDPTGAKVFWLNGMAGTGKTTILYTFCQWLDDNSRLGGNFFCSRSSASCRSLNKILPTLAYQLAHYSPAFQSKLCTILEDRQSPQNPQTLNVGSQFKWVIEMPFEKSKEAIPEGVVIVIDALDECESASETILFLETLLKFASQLPVKFMIASRPEPIIATKMQSPGFLPSTFRLHDIEQSLVEADIRKYLEEALSSMSPAPSQDILVELARRSGKLFIYAATVARYVNPEGIKPNSSKRCLQAIIDTSASHTSNLRYRDIDDLYTTILEAAFNRNAYELEELENTFVIVRTVICAMEPMTTEALSSLLVFEQEEVENILSRLQSVLHVQEGPTGLVSILHASFPDFMFDKSRSLRFHCDPGEFHGELSSFCFGVMAKELHFNICGLETSFLFDSNVPDLQQKIERNISDALFYSCRHWGNHLVKGTFAEEIQGKLVYFLETHMLFWMEVLNVTRHITTGPKLLRNALNWLKENNLESKDRKKLYDAKEFVEAFSMNTCNKSTPHIYISALPFCYKSNFVYENYWPKTQGLIRVNGSSLDEKCSGPIATWHMDYAVKSLASSHNGTSFATGSYHGVRIYDTDSGEMIAGPFEASGWSGEHVQFVTFSPDNTKLASACDRMICIWDVQTGSLIAGPLRKHTISITFLSFSLDSKKLVSGACDGAIIVWDSTTGNVISGPLQESTASVKAVGFTPDDFKIVAVSSDRRICIWDAEKGAILSGPFEAISHGDESDDDSLSDDDDLVAVALSSDQSNVAMGFFSRTILIIDTSTGAVVIGPFPCDESVRELAFSHDGKKLFSAHNSGFRVWNAQTGTLETHLVAKSRPGDFAVAPTPDGNKIISVPDYRPRQIEIWNTTNDGAVVAGSPSPPANGSIKSPVSSLAYSPDGRAIAAAFWNGCVGLWDAQTGKKSLPLFQAHPREGDISISFSPDGTNFATCFTPSWERRTDNAAVRLWDAQTGGMIAEMLAEPWEKLGPVEAVTHSHDGSKIAWSVRHSSSIPSLVTSPSFTPSFSSPSFEEYEEMSEHDESKKVEHLRYTNTIKIWDLRSGSIIEKPMQVLIGDGTISHIAFSPDDTILVLGGMGGELIMLSVDACEIIWRASSSVDPLASLTSMAFSVDGTRFACGLSGLSEGQLCVWNTTAKEMIPLPCKGRSKNAINFIAFLTDGKKILTVNDATYDGPSSICLWDAETGDILVNFDMPYSLSSRNPAVAVSPGCRQLVISTEGYELDDIRTWEVGDVLASLQGMDVERIRSEFDSEDRSDLTFYSPLSVKLAMSRIAKYHDDGWVKVDDRIIFWTSPDFRENLCYAYNPLVIGLHGTTLMDYSHMDLCIGKKWVNCWLAQ